MSEEKRKAGRRKHARRMADALHNVLTKEEIEKTDRLLYSKYRTEDRRVCVCDRRSDIDRRACKDCHAHGSKRQIT
jgi:hypothetical protein